METSEVLTDIYSRIRKTVHQATEGLDPDGLAFRPEADANSIAWLVWHLTRVQDRHLSQISGREQAWVSDGWHDRLGRPADPSDTGIGHTSAQVAAVRPDSPDALLEYHDAVCERTLAYLATVDADELDRVLDSAADPPVTVASRLVGTINDNIQHAGQARYLRGIIDRA